MCVLCKTTDKRKPLNIPSHLISFLGAQGSKDQQSLVTATTVGRDSRNGAANLLAGSVDASVRHGDSNSLALDFRLANSNSLDLGHSLCLCLFNRLGLGSDSGFGLGFVAGFGNDDGLGSGDHVGGVGGFFGDHGFGDCRGCGLGDCGVAGGDVDGSAGVAGDGWVGDVDGSCGVGDCGLLADGSGSDVFGLARGDRRGLCGGLCSGRRRLGVA